MNMKENLPIGTMLKIRDGLFDYIRFMKDAEMECCQLCRVGEEYLNPSTGPENSRCLTEALKREGIQPVSLFLGYRDRAAGNGMVTQDLRAERFAFAARQMIWANRYGIELISCHTGNFPEPGSAEYERFVTDLRELCRLAGDLGESYLFETGPEDAETLERAINDIGLDNVGINFDPANLLLYDRTDPAVFAEKLFSRIRLIHCKDGRRPESGEKLGRQTVLGEGDVHFTELTEHLIARGFRGPLIIEREIPLGQEHYDDQKKAVNLLKTIRAKFEQPQKQKEIQHARIPQKHR